MQTRNFDWRKYLFVLLITVGLFSTAIFFSNYLGNRKIDQLKLIQDQISTSILSSETEFSLLSELSCKNVSGVALSAQLGELGSKLEWSQDNLGQTLEVANLKKYYALLQIKDYLLQKRISARCGVKSAFILYFYTTKDVCTRCEEESLVLQTLRNKYPELRVYSFDYGTDLSAVKAMLNIYKIKDTLLPALVVGDDVLTGFREFAELEKLVTDTFKLQESEALQAKKPLNSTQAAQNKP